MPRQESDSLIHHIKSEIRAPSVELYLNKQRSPENGVFIFSEETGGASSLPIFLAPMLCTILDLISRMQQHLKQLLLHSSLTSCMLSHFRRRQWHPTPVLLPGKSHGQGSLVGCSPWGRKSQTWLRDFTFTFHLHTLEKEMATHSSVLAWRIPGMAEPGGLPSMRPHRVRHDWSNLAVAAAQTWLPLSKGT